MFVGSSTEIRKDRYSIQFTDSFHRRMRSRLLKTGAMSEASRVARQTISKFYASELRTSQFKRQVWRSNDVEFER